MITDTFYTLKGLLSNSRYKWRVATLVGVDTVFSEISNLSTVYNPEEVNVTVVFNHDTCKVDAFYTIAGSIVSYKAIDHKAITYLIVDSSGNDAENMFEKMGPGLISPKQEIDLLTDVGLTLEPLNNIITGLYTIIVSATAGTVTGSDSASFVVIN